jgi:hypothetical protein
MAGYKFPDELEKDDQVESKQQPEIEIEVEDDTPEEDRGRQPMPKHIVEDLDKDDLDQYDEQVQLRLKQAKKVYHDERREKEAALREQQEAIAYAKKLSTENNRMRQLITNGEREYVESVTTSASLELKMAQNQLKEAHDMGDSDKIVEAQQAMQEANMRLMRAKSYKPQALQEPESVVQPQPEQYQSVPKPDQKANAWQERNQWFGRDKVMTATALGIHEDLKDKGYEIGSDEYYNALDKTVRRRFPEEFEEAQPAKRQETVRSKSSTVVAPAVRTTASNKIRLETRQVQLAKKLGLTPEQYAHEMKRLENLNG